MELNESHFQMLAVAITVVIVIVLALPDARRLKKEIRRDVQAAAPETRRGAASMGLALLSLLLVVIGVVVLWRTGTYRFNGFFGAVEKGLVWWVMLFCALYAVSKIPATIRCVLRMPWWRTLLAAASFPAAFLLSAVVFEHVGFPVFRAFMNAWYGWMGYHVEPTQSEFLPMCEATVRGLTLFVWGATVRRAFVFRGWPGLLAAYALSAIAGCFVVHVVAAVILGIVLAILWKLFGPYLKRYGNAMEYVIAHAYRTPDPHDLHRLTTAVMWDQRFAPRDDD